MGLFSKVANIFKSNANAIVDKMEDPAKILDQNLLDMNKEFIGAKKAISSAKGEELSLTSKVDSIKEEISKWTRNAKIALSKGNEELAKKALEKKSELDQELVVIEKDRDAIAKSVAKLVDNLKDMEKKIESAKRQKDILKSKMKSARAKEVIAETTTKVNGLGTGAFDTFERMSQKVDKISNDADAKMIIEDELSGDNLEDEFAELETFGDVEDALAKMKEEMGL